MTQAAITASCACAAHQVRLAGVSGERHMCCCADCQKRTGSPAGVSWYYDSGQVLAVTGAFSTFARTGTNGTRYQFHFCTACGSTVHWSVEGTNAVGVAAGCIPAEHHLPPQDVVWVRSKPDWFRPPRDIPWHDMGTRSPIVHQPE